MKMILILTLLVLSSSVAAYNERHSDAHIDRCIEISRLTKPLIKQRDEGVMWPEARYNIRKKYPEDPVMEYVLMVIYENPTVGEYGIVKSLLIECDYNGMSW